MQKIKTYEIDELANLVPMASKLELEALMEDIRNNGQQQPALIFNGKIIDGRNRQVACKELGIELKVEEISENKSRLDVINLVKSMTTRRSLSTTQAAMSAIKEIHLIDEMKSTDSTVEKLTKKEAAKKWAVSKRLVERASKIYNIDQEIAKDLFDGKTVSLYDEEKHTRIVTNKITTIERLLQQTKSTNRVKVLEDHSSNLRADEEKKKYKIDFNDYLPDVDVQEYFWKQYKDLNEIPILKRDIASLLTKVANINEELEEAKKTKEVRRVLFKVSFDNVAEEY